MDADVNIPDVRLTGKFYLPSDVYVKIDAGLANNKLKLKDAFIQKAKNKHIFRLGYMFGFIGMDQSSSSNDFLFLTGSNSTETFYLGRRTGVSYNYAGDRLYTSVGIFCGDKLEKKSNIQRGINSSLRVVYRPIKENDHLLHIGMGCVYRQPDKNKESQKRSLTLGSTANCYLNVPYVFSHTFEDCNEQWQWNVEALGILKKFFYQAEYTGMVVKHTEKGNYKAAGAYIECGALLKGDMLNYDYTDALPVCPTTPGSWMVFFRMNVTDLNDNCIKAGRMYDASVGSNYYFNNYLTFRINYSHQWTDQYTALGERNWGTLQTRIQFRF